MACRSVNCCYEGRGGAQVSIPLSPFGTRTFLTRLGLSRKRVHKELVRMFRYGKTAFTGPKGKVQLKPVFDNGPRNEIPQDGHESAQ